MLLLRFSARVMHRGKGKRVPGFKQKEPSWGPADIRIPVMQGSHEHNILGTYSIAILHISKCPYSIASQFFFTPLLLSTCKISNWKVIGRENVKYLSKVKKICRCLINQKGEKCFKIWSFIITLSLLQYFSIAFQEEKLLFW